jgi:hypothetical protein
MKKWAVILLGSIGCFLILKSLLKLDKEQNKAIILPVIHETVQRAIPVKIETTQIPSPKLLNNLPQENYLMSGKVNLNSKR